jgi:hypothetical protein
MSPAGDPSIRAAMDPETIRVVQESASGPAFRNAGAIEHARLGLVRQWSAKFARIAS